MPIDFDEQTEQLFNSAIVRDRDVASGVRAVRDSLLGGRLELCGADGRTVASWDVGGDGGQITLDKKGNARWTVDFTGFAYKTKRSGRPTQARFRDMGGTVRITGFTVGMGGTEEVVLDNTWFGNNTTVELGPVVLDFPYVRVDDEKHCTITRCRILGETKDRIALAYDLNGGAGSTFDIPPGAPQLRYAGERHTITVDPKYLAVFAPDSPRRVRALSVTDGAGKYALGDGVHHHSVVPWIEQWANVITAAGVQVDWTKQVTIVIAGKKRDQGEDLDAEFPDMLDAMLAAQDARHEEEAAEQAKAAQKAQKRAKAVAKIADGDEDIAEFFANILDARQDAENKWLAALLEEENE